MKHSMHSSCYIASFSNLLAQNNPSITDELLFGISQSFSFMYNYTNLPQSGWTFSALGSTHQGIFTLSTLLNREISIILAEEENYLATLSTILNDHSSAIIEISVREYMKDPQSKELFSYVKESNVNHYVTVHKIDSEFVYFYDNFSFKMRKLSISDFLCAVYPKDTNVFYPSEGRIFYYNMTKQSNMAPLSKQMILEAIHHTAELFLLSNWESKGLNGLDHMSQELKHILSEKEHLEKNKKLFYYFCILAGNGGLYRRDYIKFLKKVASLYPEEAIILKKIIGLYKIAQKKWKNVSKEIASIDIHSASLKQAFSEIENLLNEVALIEKKAMYTLWSWTENHVNKSVTSSFPIQKIETNSFNTLEEIIRYFMNSRIEFDLIVTKKNTIDLNIAPDDQMFYWTPSNKKLSTEFWDGTINYGFKTRPLKELTTLKSESFKDQIAG
ncbi:DUF4872 domain-containing protein [Enterococcus sp. CWB-B31]|uniref:DUF4872 domain-containing protein n=1 Tax=Enterococcus sp. CWB-B31 TaxID=2885159 RepID=UPI001E499003|nr:DUF4872 domain-containing protein [Enterococcus sp. CWB-B31]MCB5953720.1 DUF4872 domain-containing protein [Enterococcus sp. CWB-B31]